MNRFELAGKAWPILIATAETRSTISYKELASRLGYKAARPAKFPLWTIQDFCMERNLPPLTILVVNEKTGKPGAGFIAWPHDKLSEGFERVYSEVWRSIPPPFTEDTVQSISVRANDSKDHFVDDHDVTVNGRGPYQEIFRKKLIDAYDGTCALCDTKLNAMLVASHIVPWAIDRKNRLNPKNGLLLCRTHDTLFESGWITIQDDLSVTIESSDDFGGDLLQIIQRTKRELRSCKRWATPEPMFLQWHRDNAKLSWKGDDDSEQHVG